MPIRIERSGSYPAASRGDGDQTGNRARGGAEQARMTAEDPFAEHPGQGRRGGGNGRVEEDQSRSEPLASRLEPALKPYQPTHRRLAPIMVRTRLCGGIGSLP